MNRTILRCLCACLLMGIATVVVAGVFAAQRYEKKVYVWQSIRFATQEPIELYDENGALLQLLEPTDGIAVSKLLPQGAYLAQTQSGTTRLYLHDDRSVTVEGSFGYADGATVHLSKEKTGCVAVEFLARQEFYTFYLKGQGVTKKQTIRTGIGSKAKCEFVGVTYGTYTLWRDGEALTSLKVSEETPILTVALARP